MRCVTFDGQNQRWFACTLFDRIGALSAQGVAQFHKVPSTVGLNAIAPLRNSPRGVAVCVTSDGRLLLWQGEERFHVLRAMTNSIEAVAVSPDSSWLALAGIDTDIGCIDLVDLSALAAFRGHSAPVRCLAFHPEGHLLASAGDDGAIRLWDLNRGTAARMYSGHSCRVPAISFTPDGDWLASADEAGAIRFWSILAIRRTYWRLGTEKFLACVLMVGPVTLSLRTGKGPCANGRYVGILMLAKRAKPEIEIRAREERLPNSVHPDPRCRRPKQSLTNEQR